MPDIFTPPNKPVQPDVVNKTYVHAFSSFCENPGGVTFETEHPNEHILLFLKKHFVTNVPWIVTTIVLFLIPSLLRVLFAIFESPFFVPNSYLQIFELFYYMAVFTYAFVSFITWFYNVTLVTQERVIDIDFSELVYHDVAQTKLNLVEDVNYTQTGFIRTFFNYGDVFIQTAGGKENLEALAVPQPGRAVRIIGNLIGKGTHSG